MDLRYLMLSIPKVHTHIDLYMKLFFNDGGEKVILNTQQVKYFQETLLKLLNT